MSQKFNLVTKKQLLEIVSLSRNKSDPKYLDFFLLWENFIFNYANDNIVFINSQTENFKDAAFRYSFTFFDQNLTLIFDIQRILKQISNHSIRYTILNSEIMHNNYSYTKENTCYFSENISTFPVLVYFPTELAEYLVIDGNHRVTSFIQQHKTFNFHLIKPNDLYLGCFFNLNSWIIYQFYVNYYGIHEYDFKFYNQFLKRNKEMLNSVANILQDQLK